MVYLRVMTDRGPLKVAAIYFLFGFVWIIGSDTLVLWIATSPEDVARLQTVKGWVYVLLTTFLVYGLMRLYSRQKNAVLGETIRSSRLLSQALEQKKLLVRELHHRVKNNLQTVLAFLNLADHSEPPGTVHRRVHTMADTHEIAMAFPDPTTISLTEFVKRVVGTTTRTPGQHIRFTTADMEADTKSPPVPEGDADRSAPATLTVNEAVPLGMCLNEVLRWYEPEAPHPTTGSGKVEIGIELMVDRTHWSVRVHADQRMAPQLSSTARALCDAWATQLSGRIEYADTTTALIVPRDAAHEARPEAVGK